MEEKKLIKVKAVRDDSSHWYVIPETMHQEWLQLINKLYETDFEDNDLINKFDEKFSKYTTGGDLNNIQLYAEI